MTQAMASTATTMQSTPDRLLAGAERLVVREGVHALTVRRIADEAGVNSALVRYHFGDTEGLLGELALRNAARIANARVAILQGLEGAETPDFAGAVDALVVPLWSSAAMNPAFRAIVVLDEVFARAGEDLNARIWALFADGVARVTAALALCLPHVDATALAWRIRFVTAAALDIPPRGMADRRAGARKAYGGDSEAERLEHFRSFARDALRMDSAV